MASHSYRYWQATTVVGLFIGYSGYYICRSNLAIAAPLLIQEFGEDGLTKEIIGQIASVGVIFYAIGKVINGVAGDFLGGKRVFIGGMIGSIAATLLFGLSSGIAAFFIAWAINRSIQSMGWGGLVKTTANWFSFQSYGRIMSILSLSFLTGDIVAKLLLGQLLKWQVGWRELFYISAAALACISILSSFLVKARPEKMGFQAPTVNPTNLFVNQQETERPESLPQLLLPYVKSLPFLLMLVMSFGLTAIREAFNFWLPTYLFETTGLSEGESSQYSALFSFFGVFSILSAGFLSDKLKGRRGFIIVSTCLPVTAILLLMSFPMKSTVVPLILVSGIGLLVLGPYSFLAGAMSLDVGGRKGAATAAGLMDAVGYVGGTLAVWVTGYLSQRAGWSYVFILLTGLAFLTAMAALVYATNFEKKPDPVRVVDKTV